MFKRTPLKMARLLEGLTQQELSEKAGISTSVISEIEQGWRIMKPRELEKIRKVLPNLDEV